MAYSEDSLLARKVRGPKMRVSGFPAMESLCNAFASIMATMARKEIRSGIDVTVFGYEVVRHGDYLRALFVPSAIYLMSFPESNGAGLIKAHPRLLGKVLDMSLGGDGEFEETNFSRQLTQIDLSIYGRFVDLVVDAFHETIVEMCGRSEIGPPIKTRFEEQPGMVRIAPDRSEILVIKLNFHIGDDKRGAGMDFVLPITTIEPLKKDLNSNIGGSEAMNAMWADYMNEQVRKMSLRADGIVDLGQFTVGELSRLEQGQVLELPNGAINDVEIRIDTAEGSCILARGRLGIKGRHKALRLNADPDQEFLRPMLELAPTEVEGDPV